LITRKNEGFYHVPAPWVIATSPMIAPSQNGLSMYHIIDTEDYQKLVVISAGIGFLAGAYQVGILRSLAWMEAYT
jgi:hypothetical protein